MFTRTIAVLILLAAAVLLGAQTPSTPNQGYTLTVVVEGVNNQDGNVGMLVFNSPKGWAENREMALRDIIVPAHPGTVTIRVPDLPPGDYGVAVLHDVNRNHKMDRNWLGMPKEQWAMSNNPHATIKAPPFDKARFTLNGNMTITVRMK